MRDKMTIILFSGDLDKALAAFTLATTAASMGMEVTIFFTFWGLNVVKKSRGRIESQGLLRKLLNLMNRGGANRVKLSKFNMLGVGTKMMKKLMKDVNMPDIDEMIKQAQELGVKFVVCTTTMGVMGISKEAFIDEVDSFAGAATYLSEAKEAKINLFI